MSQQHFEPAALSPPGANNFSVSGKYSGEIQERLREIREGVWRYQDRSFQLEKLETHTRLHIEANYPKNSDAFQRLHAVLDRIFNDKDPISRMTTVSRYIRDLMPHTPCLFTFLPGLDTHQSLPQSSIVLVDRYTTIHSRQEVNLKTQLTRDPRSTISSPITVANMRGVISEELGDLMVEAGLIPIFHRFRRPLNAEDVDREAPTVQSKQEADEEKIRWAKKFRERAYFSCGANSEGIELAKRLIQEGAGGICVDIAIGNSEMCVATVLQLKDFIKAGGYATQIVAGNVDTDEGYLALSLAGADCVKVGIGPGSPCTTRLVTRAGAGQGSALMNVSRAKFVMGEEGANFIADGGIDGSGDVLVALALQASAVMTGKLTARTYESGALKREIDGKKFAWYFGEASSWARLYEQGGVKDGMAVEGDAKWIECSGSFLKLVEDLTGGLRNALPYYNARTIAELQIKFSFQQQLCDLILGGTTGIYQNAPGTPLESGTRLG